MRRVVGLTVLTLLCSAGRVQAQNQTAEKDATSVAQTFFNALSESRWENAAELLDLKEFDQIRASRIRDSRSRHHSKPVSGEFAGVPNADSLSSLSPLQAAARWLEAKDPRWQLQHSPYADSACKTKAAEYPPPARMTVLATAVADTLAYAIVAPGSEATAEQRAHPVLSYGEFLNVMILRRQGTGWRVVPSEMALGPTGFAIICKSDAAISRGRKKTSK